MSISPYQMPPSSMFSLGWKLGMEKGGKWKVEKKGLLPSRGEQSDTGADPTDRRQPSRTAFVTDRLSRGRRSDGEFHSDAGAVLPSEPQLQTELVTETTDMAIFCFVL